MSSQKYIFTSIRDRPRAVAVILGHLGVTEEQLERYTKDLYQAKECSTIAARSPPFQFMTHRLQHVAVDVIKEAATILRPTPASVPLVIHLFSNGGAFILEDIEILLKNEDSNEDLVSRQDTALVSERLKFGYELFDSCPCYLHNVWHPSFIGDAYPSKSWSRIGRSIYFVGSALSLTMWCTMTFGLHRPGQFWNHMLEATATDHQIYWYTTADMLSDASRIDDLIEHRKGLGDGDITVFRYDDSNHCRLLNDHEDVYHESIERALTAACERGTLLVRQQGPG
jgi:hypothetical protein